MIFFIGNFRDLLIEFLWKNTLETSEEDVETTLETSEEDVKTKLETSEEDVETTVKTSVKHYSKNS